MTFSEKLERVLALSKLADSAPTVREPIYNHEEAGSNALYEVLEAAPVMAQALLILLTALEIWSNAPTYPNIYADNALLAALKTAEKELENL